MSRPLRALLLQARSSPEGDQSGADVAALAVGDPPRLAAGAILEEELVILGAPLVHGVEELVVLGPGRHAQHPLGQEGELPPRRPGPGHVVHLGRVGEPRGDVHRAAPGVVPVLEARRADVLIAVQRRVQRRGDRRHPLGADALGDGDGLGVCQEGQSSREAARSRAWSSMSTAALDFLSRRRTPGVIRTDLRSSCRRSALGMPEIEFIRHDSSKTTVTIGIARRIGDLTGRRDLGLPDQTLVLRPDESIDLERDEAVPRQLSPRSVRHVRTPLLAEAPSCTCRTYEPPPCSGLPTDTGRISD